MFAKNFWYVAARSDGLEETSLCLVLLYEHVVLFRTSDGSVVALEDRCAHRTSAVNGAGHRQSDTLRLSRAGLRLFRQVYSRTGPYEGSTWCA